MNIVHSEVKSQLSTFKTQMQLKSEVTPSSNLSEIVFFFISNIMYFYIKHCKIDKYVGH